MLIPELEKRAGMSLFRPRMQFFEGRDGIQNLMEDIFQYSQIESYVFWPIEYMLDVITPEFLRYHNKVRIQKKKSLKSIWQRDQTINLNKPPYLGSGERYLREIRVTPYNMDFQMGCWFYANKAVFISSQTESFGFMIESVELTDLLKVQHDVIWQISTPFEINPKGGNLFLEEIDES